MFDDVQQRHQAKAAIGKRQVLGRRQARLVAALAANKQRLLVIVDALDAPVAAEMVHHVACAAADVQDTPLAARSDKVIEHTQKPTRTRVEPPVLVFENLRRLIFHSLLLVTRVARIIDRNDCIDSVLPFKDVQCRCLLLYAQKVAAVEP